MPRKHDSRQSAFDFDAGCLASDVSKTIGSLSESTPSPADWQEVPQARFLSWSIAMQNSYCRARDLDSAISAEGRGEDPNFYLERAEMYR